MGPGLACLIDDRGRPVVFHVDHGSPADGRDRAGDGDRLRQRREGNRRDGPMDAPAADVCRLFERPAAPGRAAWGFVRRDKKGDRLALVLALPDGASKSVEVAADLAALSPEAAGAEAGDRRRSGRFVDEARRPDRLHLRQADSPGARAVAGPGVRELGDIRGLIIDVRGNSGGGFDTTTAFVNFDPAHAAARGPVRPRYAGRIALLLDERTISAGEGWASWFVARRRARVFGSTSAGISSRKVTYDLTYGRYKVVVPVKAYSGSLDRPIERRGLEPDVEVRCTASDLSRGRDTVLETAAEWLRQNGR